MRRRTWGPVLLGLLVGLCSLGLPALGARAQEAQLLRQTLVRPAQENMLAERAREIPVVYALYRRRYLVGAGTSEAEPAQPGTLREKTAALQTAGVLTEDQLRAVEEILENSSDASPEWQTAEFWTASRRPSSPEAGETGTLLLCWHTQTGLVVSLSADLDAGDTDTAALLQSYRAYLGVEALGDWTDVPLGDGAASACWSRTGQLYLYCFARRTNLSFGAVSVSPEEEEAAATFLQ